ncbi:MAG: type II toxin-antitoxin system RelE/ParE family toxin [Pirellulales bacterium]|nr:type II toxin-antitoxin system RelE/ParE family toxin [Pirellulales bacterium]
MPHTEVCFFKDDDGSVPVLEFIEELAKRDRKVARKCVARIEALQEFGHELRRPLADILRDGIYELRIRVGRVNYRLLYFFHGQHAAVLAHALTKEKEVPNRDIERAIERMERFKDDPERHTYEEANPNG